MFVVVARLSSNRMQTSGTIEIVGLSTCYRFRCCLVAIMRRITVHVYIVKYIVVWLVECPLCPPPPPPLFCRLCLGSLLQKEL